MSTLRGISALLLLSVNTIVLCVPLYLLGVLRLVSPRAARARMSRGMDGIVQLWVRCHRAVFRLLDLTRIATRWDDAEALSAERWYLVISNHQSWADILILQNVFWNRVPMLKFFTKRQLIWVPMVGLAMWFLGFPYVRRLSRERIAADPSLAALDRQATLDACRRFRDHPTSVLAFLEGTRFTAAKHAAQEARFEHLLNHGSLDIAGKCRDACDGRLHVGQRLRDVGAVFEPYRDPGAALVGHRIHGVDLVEKTDLGFYCLDYIGLDIFGARTRPLNGD